MVGVPGRSKACVTCKKRRIRCDSSRPGCTPCRKSGLGCGGYETPRLFVNSSQETWPRGSSYTNPVSRRSSAKPVRQPVVAGIAHSHSLARTAYEERYLHSFLDAYLPSGHRSGIGQHRWTSVVRETCRDDRALSSALLANGLAALGTRVREGWVMRESFRMYGRSLGELTRALREPTSARKDSSLLSATRLLSTFELFVGSDHAGSIVVRSRNWELHVKGELALLQARGPAAFVLGNAHATFADGRLNYYIWSATQRRRLFVSEPRWKTVPWTKTPKTRKDLLLDLLLDVPGVLEDYDHMSSCTDAATRVKLRDALIQKCWDLDRGLQKWAASGHHPIDDISSPSAEVPLEVSNEDLASAELKALYWSGCLLLYSTLQLAVGPEGAKALPGRADHTGYIRNIAGIMESLLDPQSGMFGQHVAVLPLAMALQFVMASAEPLEPPSELRAALVGSLEGPGGDSIRGFLISLNADSERHPEWMSDIAGAVGIRARARQWVGERDSAQSWEALRRERRMGSPVPLEESNCVVGRLLYDSVWA